MFIQKLVLGWLVTVSAFSLTGRAQTVTVHVADVHAAPVADAEVTAYEQRLSPLTGDEQTQLLCDSRATDRLGRVRLELDYNQARQVMILARKAGYALGWDVLPHRDDADPVVNILLDEPVAFGGSIIDHAGRPVANAVVRAHPKVSKLDRLEQRPVIGPLDWLTTRTDSAGRFEYTCFGNDVRADFLVTAADQAINHRFTPHYLSSCGYEAGRKDVRLVLPKTADVRGQVVDDNGRGIGRMTIIIQPDQGNRDFRMNYEPLVQQTDGKGGFVFRDIPIGKHFLTVLNTDIVCPWVDTMIRVDTSDATAAEAVRIGLQAGGIADVTMQEDATGSPIEAMYLLFSQTPADANDCWFSRIVQTGSDGNVQIMLPAGECRVRFWDERPFERKELSLPEIETGQTHPVTFSLTRQTPIVGKVVDPSGNPVENCLIKMTWGQRVRTDAGGRFACHYDSLREGMYLIARDTGSHRAAVLPIGDPDTPKELTLKPAPTLSGRIVDPDGVPIAAARVSIEFSGPGYLSDCCPEVLTDTDGRFEVEAIPSELPDGFAFRISVMSMNHGALTYKRLHIREQTDDRIQLEPIVMQPADRTLDGIVKDADGMPAVGIPIILQGDGQYGHSTVTDGAGRFALRRICSGKIRLQAGIGGDDYEPGFIEANGGDTGLEILMGQQRVHVPEVSLLGEALPGWEKINGGQLPQALNDTALLVCFWDFSQRPSRHLIGQLDEIKSLLAEKQIRLILVHAGPADANVEKWLDEKALAGYTLEIVGDTDAVRQAWGIKALPWLILTDAERTVIAEGISVDELETKLDND